MAPVALSVARAFQPEICPLRLERPRVAAVGRLGEGAGFQVPCGYSADSLVSREAAKPRRETHKVSDH